MNSFGENFRVSLFGESHGAGIGVVIDGVPSGCDLDVKDFDEDLSRRRAGAKGTTPRVEKDIPEIVSGVFEGKTTGAPIMILFRNENTRSKDYSKIKNVPRPGHADFVAFQKYGAYNDYRGGGHFSGRMTLAIVAAGVVAKRILKERVKINANLVEAGGISDINLAIENAIKEDVSIGGIVECRIDGVPVGAGEPFFNSVESQLSHIIFSIPAIKGIEFGSGFDAARMKGHEHNDEYLDVDGKTKTNNAGGINGGISNGNPILFRVAVKPTSSISRAQQSVNLENKETENLSVEGRHDRCIALRVPPVLEAASAIVIADLMLTAQMIKRVE